MMPRISLLFLVLCLTAIQAVFSFPIDAELENRGSLFAPTATSEDVEQRLDIVTDPRVRRAIEKQCKTFFKCLWTLQKEKCQRQCIEEGIAKYDHDGKMWVATATLFHGSLIEAGTFDVRWINLCLGRWVAAGLARRQVSSKIRVAFALWLTQLLQGLKLYLGVLG